MYAGGVQDELEDLEKEYAEEQKQMKELEERLGVSSLLG